VLVIIFLNKIEPFFVVLMHKLSTMKKLLTLLSVATLLTACNQKKETPVIAKKDISIEEKKDSTHVKHFFNRSKLI